MQGKGGYGVGQSQEANAAVFKAVRFALLGAVAVPLYRGHTVHYPSRTTFVRSKISIFPRPLEFGLSGAPVLMDACELLGIRDLTVKVRPPALIYLQSHMQCSSRAPR